MILREVAVGLLLFLGACVKPSVVAAPPIDLVVRAVDGPELQVASGTGDHEPTFPVWDMRDEVDVEWRGRWWPATVLERKSTARYLVHYDGYADEWDEVVGPERIRLRTLAKDDEAHEPGDPDVDP